jgi:hypothetical protein
MQVFKKGSYDIETKKFLGIVYSISELDKSRKKK